MAKVKPRKSFVILSHRGVDAFGGAVAGAWLGFVLSVIIAPRFVVDGIIIGSVVAFILGGLI